MKFWSQFPDLENRFLTSNHLHYHKILHFSKPQNYWWWELLKVASDIFVARWHFKKQRSPIPVNSKCNISFQSFCEEGINFLIQFSRGKFLLGSNCSSIMVWNQGCHQDPVTESPDEMTCAYQGLPKHVRHV